MELESRYVVLKVKDVREALSTDELVTLADLFAKIEIARVKRGAKPLSAVVVEADWPEYEATVAALKLRIEQQGCEHKWQWWLAPGVGTVCRKCGLKHYLAKD